MITLKAEKREVLGKKTRSIRKHGLIPAELYGRGIPNIHLSIPAKEFLQAYKEAGEHSVLYIEIEGESRPVLIHSVQEHQLKPEILTVDFHQIRMDEKVRAHVPLEFQGEPPAVKEQEGILIKSMDEIEVEALPADLPHSIAVDLSGLTELDESLHVKDLPKSDKYEYLVDEETVVASVTAPKEEEIEEAVPEEAVPEEEVAEEKAAEEAPPAGGVAEAPEGKQKGKEGGDET